MKTGYLFFALSFSVSAVHAEICAVNQFGSVGTCFSTLSMCQSWVSTSGGTCAYIDTSSNGKSARSPDGSYESVATGVPPIDIESLNEEAKLEFRQKVRSAVEQGCERGGKDGLPIASNVAALVREIATKSAAAKTTEQMKRTFFDGLKVLNDNSRDHREWVMKVHQPRIEEARRKLYASLAQPLSKDLLLLEKIHAINDTTYIYAMLSSYLVAQKNSGLSDDQLRRLITENCIEKNRNLFE